jgi:TPP-dependent indolepyruvate ferredoxin oxidoreductase alpha subunit
MNGRDALVEAIRACTDCQYTVPGYPITELGARTNAELVVNEKTALEYALGDSLSGRRAAVIIKNVGLNACADPLVQSAAQGLIGGLVIVAGDDPLARLSQTAQDSRYYGELAELPVIEPDQTTCYTSVEAALQASEMFSRVAILRLTPQLLDGEVKRDVVRREDRKGRLALQKWTMNGRVTAAEELYVKMFGWSDASPLNRWNGEPVGVGAAPGNSRVVTVHPPPARVAQMQTINEYGRTFVRDHRGLRPPVPQKRPETMEDRGYYKTFCAACPYKSLLAILAERDMQVICDAGCSVLGMTPPFELGLASYGMGSSIAVAARSTGVALIGDYALLHSGMNALVDVYEKKLPLLSIVMKNNSMAMTGRQPAYDPVPYLAWAKPVVCRAEDTETLGRVIHRAPVPVTVIVEGECPEGSRHETVEY